MAAPLSARAGGGQKQRNEKVINQLQAETAWLAGEKPSYRDGAEVTTFAAFPGGGGRMPLKK